MKTFIIVDLSGVEPEIVDNVKAQHGKAALENFISQKAMTRSLYAIRKEGTKKALWYMEGPGSSKFAAISFGPSTSRTLSIEEA